jgi:hypothetical protein
MVAVARPQSTAAVKDCRAYLLKPDGHVLRRIDLVCDDDDAAKARAEQLVDGHDVELWHRDKKIATFRHDNPIGR